MPPEKSDLPAWPAAIVRLAALWVLFGASFKLFLGTPADLPQVIRDLPLELGLTYKLAISTELFITMLALGRPKLGWLPIVLLYVVFEVVLGIQLSKGVESCGCLGSKITISPAQMMGIDSAFLLLVLASNPWRPSRVGRGLPLSLTLIACLTGVALPWLLDREATAPPATAGPGTPATGEQGVLRDFVVLSPERWVGQTVYETPLAEWVQVERADGSEPGDISELPIDGAWVLWKWDCDHCAAHLEHLANHPPPVPFLTLIRLHQKTDTEDNRAVYIIPDGPTVAHGSTPATVDWVTTTPCELMLEGATITAARENATLENSVIPTGR